MLEVDNVNPAPGVNTIDVSVAVLANVREVVDSIAVPVVPSALSIDIYTGFITNEDNNRMPKTETLARIRSALVDFMKHEKQRLFILFYAHSTAYYYYSMSGMENGNVYNCIRLRFSWI